MMTNTATSASKTFLRVFFIWTQACGFCRNTQAGHKSKEILPDTINTGLQIIFFYVWAFLRNIVNNSNWYMKVFLLFAALFFFSGISSAQTYFTAGGLRLGTDWGLTIQQRVAKKTTVETILQSSLFREEVMITILGEQHGPLLSRRFNVYGGAGLHKGWSTARRVNGEDQPEYKGPFGITLIGGAEMTIGRLNLSYDFKPAINISGGEQTFYAQSGISARYVIVKKPAWEKNKKGKKKKKKSGGGFRLW